MNDMINEQGKPKGLSLQEITNLLGSDPSRHEVKPSNRSKSIGIGIMEGKLDRIFGPFGWSWTVIEMKAYGNEITCHGRLVIHINGMTKTVDGLGATMITTAKGELPILQNKIANTMRKDFPSSGSFAFKNACKKLGKWFGRDINRTEITDEDYTVKLSKKDLVIEIQNLESDNARLQWINSNPHIQGEDYVQSALAENKNRLKALPAPQAGEQLTIGK